MNRALKKGSCASEIENDHNNVIKTKIDHNSVIKTKIDHNSVIKTEIDHNVNETK